MLWKGQVRVAGLVLAGLVVGYLLQSPIAGAVTSAVKVTSGSAASQLKIVSGKAKVDIGAALVQRFFGPTGSRALVTQVDGPVFTDNNGDSVIASGTAGATACTDLWILNAVVVDSASGSSTVSIAAAGTPVWSGTATAGQHLNDTFDGGVFSSKQPLTVSESGSGTWYLYGFCASGNTVRAATRGALRHP